MPNLYLSAFALNADPVHGSSMLSPSVNLEGANPDVAVSATVASKYGFIGEAVICRGTGVENQTLLDGDFSVGMLARLMGPRKDVFPSQRHQGATQNQFSPLFGLSS